MKVYTSLMQKIFPKKQYALVLSYGCAGSYWLAQTLHKLENVFCSIGDDHPLSGIKYYHNQKEFEQLLALIKTGRFQDNGFLIYDLIYNGDKISTYHLLHNMGISVPKRRADSHNILLSELTTIADELRPESRHIINVHGLNVQTYLNSIHPKNKKIKVFDLIRHPVPTAQTWINAFLWIWNNCAERKKIFEERKQTSKDKLHLFTQKYKVDFDDPLNLMSFFVYEHISGVANSFKLLNCPRLKFEDLRTKPEKFTAFYQLLFDSKPEQQFLDFVYSPENLSNGRITSSPQSQQPLQPEAQFSSWTNFQRQLFSSLLKDKNISDIYHAHQYDLSFVK